MRNARLDKERSEVNHLDRLIPHGSIGLWVQRKQTAFLNFLPITISRIGDRI